MDELYSVRDNPTTRDVGLEVAARHGWRTYPVHGVNGEGVCRCRKREGCPHPGKHPTPPRGHLDASAEASGIARLFERWPGDNLGVATGKVSGVVVLDEDAFGGASSVTLLEREHGPLPATLLHHSGGGGLHRFYGYPEGVERVPTRDIWPPGASAGSEEHGPGLELLGDGGKAILPPSRHEGGGCYETLLDLPIAPCPPWLVELASRPRLAAVEGDGPEPTPSRFVLPERIVESSPSRNRALFDYGCSLRAHGWDHDSILEELRKANAGRCVPPMDDPEVRGIARSVVSRYGKGKAGPVVRPEVLETVACLEDLAGRRPKKGTAAHSRWAAYRVLLDCSKAHGRMHEDRDVAVSISRREHAMRAGVSYRTLYRALDDLEASGLVYVVSAGEGAAPGVLAVRSPRRGRPDTTRTTLRVGGEGGSGASLYRLRHGRGIGKVSGAVMEAVLERGGKAGRAELAGRLRMKPNTLGKHLRRLVDRGLLERRGRGRYRPAKNWERALYKERLKHGELEAEDKDRRRYEEDRTEHREYLEKRKEQVEREAVPSEAATAEPEPPRARGPKAPERRIERLVRQGMAPRWARAEVYGEEEL